MKQVPFLDQFKEHLKRNRSETSVVDGVDHDYLRLAYGDLLNQEPTTHSRPVLEFIEGENYTPYVDALIYVQGVDITALVKGQLQWQMSDVAGHNTLSLELANDDDRLVLTPQNFAETKAREWGMIEGVDVDYSRPAFSHYEREKREIFNLKIGEELNPEGRLSDGSRFFTRFPLAPNTPIIQKMDPIRMWVPVPHFPHSRWDTEEWFWIPAFTGYVNDVSVEDNYITGASTLKVECADFRAMILRGMRLSFDAATGITDPSSAVFGAPVSTELSGISITEENISFQDSIFADVISGNIFGQPGVDKKIEEAVADILLGQKEIKDSDVPDSVVEPPDWLDEEGKRKFEENNRRRLKGVKGVRNGGVYEYTHEASERDRRAFLEEWHRLAVFGPKRRPWTTMEVMEVGRETKTGGVYAPNNIALYSLVPAAGSGSGPRGLADVGSLNAQMSHDVSWNTRDDVLKQLVESIDYQLFVTGTGDILLEFPMTDFNPEDFGEFSSAFSVEHHVENANLASEAGELPCGVLSTIGFGVGAPAPGGLLGNMISKAFAWSPTIARRCGVRIHTISHPYLLHTQQQVSAQLCAIELQKLLADANNFDVGIKYRPYLTPNRPFEHKRRSRIGKTVTVGHSAGIGDSSASASTSVSLNHPRTWTGQRDENGEKIYETLAGGRSTPLSMKVGFSEGSITAASGIYTYPNINDLRAAVEDKIDALMATARTVTGYVGGNALEITVVDIGGGKYLDVDAAADFVRMREAAAREGINLSVTSAFRSNEEQEYFYNRYIADRENAPPASRPGYSNHQSGAAVDIGGTTSHPNPPRSEGVGPVYAWLDANASRFNFRRIASEAWHWEHLPTLARYRGGGDITQSIEA